MANEKEIEIQKPATMMSVRKLLAHIEQVAAKHGIDLQAEARKSEEVERFLAELRNQPEFDRINHGPFKHDVV